MSSSGRRSAPNEAYRALPGQGRRSPRRAARAQHGPAALRRAGESRPGQINTTDLDSQAGQGPARLAAGLQRAGRQQRAPDRDRGRDPGRLTRLRTPRARWSTLPAASSKAPASPTRRRWCVADSGYWHTEQMHQLAADGIAVLIPPESGLRKTPRPGWNSGRYAFMRNVLQTEHGTALYKQRQHLIETAVRLDQTQPRLRSLPPPRQSRRPDRVAPDHRNPQPLEAPQAPARNHRGLTAAAGAQRHRPAPSQSLALAGSPAAKSDLRDGPVESQHFAALGCRAVSAGVVF